MFGKIHTRIGEPVDLERVAGTPEERLYDFFETDILLPCDSIEIPVANDNEYRRWYQVVVANLADEEYLVITSNNPRRDVKRGMIPVESGETVEFIIHFEPDPNRTETIQVEATVIEYATDDEEGPRQVYYRKSYLLAPYFKAERFSVTPAKRLLQVRPWTRQLNFEVTLRNQNELSASNITLALLPKDSRGRPIEMDEEERISIPVSGVLRAHQELKIECVLPLKERPQNPIYLEVVAEYEVPRHIQSQHAGDYASKTPRPLQIAYVPYMRTWWPDWLIAGIWMLLIMAVLFGLPPVYKPELLVYLEFEGYERGAVPEGKIAPESRVVLERYDVGSVSYGNLKPHPVAGAKVLPERRGDRIRYYARLIVNPRTSGNSSNRETWRLRNLLPYNDAETYVGLKLELLGDRAFLSQYDLTQPLLRDPDTDEPIDEIRFSRAFMHGYKPNRVKMFIPYASGSLKLHLPQWEANVNKVKVYAVNPSTEQQTEVKTVECPNGQPTTTTLQASPLLGNQNKATIRVIAVSENEAHRTEQLITIQRGDPPREVRLPKPRLVGHLILQIDSAPPGATVTVNGEPVGLTPLKRSVPAPTGGSAVTIGLTKEGYREKTLIREVKAGMMLNLGRITLTKLEENPPPGGGNSGRSTEKSSQPTTTLTVVSNLPDAAVLVGGQVKGVTKRLNADLLYESAPIRVSHNTSVRVQRTGYRPLPPERDESRYLVWLVPNDGEFLKEASTRLNLGYALVRQINAETNLAVRAIYETDTQTLKIIANKDCWVQVYFSNPNQGVRPELGADASLAYGETPPANNFVRRGEPLEVPNIGWGVCTHLYVIATTHDIGEQPDLRDSLRQNPSIARQGDWCVVGLKRPPGAQ